jgi:hypothetical protein
LAVRVRAPPSHRPHRASRVILFASFVDVAADEPRTEFVSAPGIGEPCLPRLAGRFCVLFDGFDNAPRLKFRAGGGELRLQVRDD